MFMLTFAIYITGLYISNIKSMFHITMEKDKKVTVINGTDTDNKNFNKAIEMLKKEKGITLIPQGLKGIINTTSIMGFTNDYVQYSFRTKEDFETYCKFTGVKIKSVNKNKELGNGSVIMSSLQADNRGMELGDTLKKQEGESLDQKYTLDAITDNDGYSTYYISNTNNAMYLVLDNSMDSKSFKSLTRKLETEYKVYARDYNYYIDRIDGQMESFYYIYFFIIILLSVVMAITVNAAFAGFYQHRQGEFALYKAIGVSGKKLRLKIISEVLLIDVTGIVPGVCIIMLGIYLANSLCLIPNGFRLLYYDNMPMAGMITSNLVILIPVIILQGRRLIKADICNY